MQISSDYSQGLGIALVLSVLHVVDTHTHTHTHAHTHTHTHTHTHIYILTDVPDTSGQSLNNMGRPKNRNNCFQNNFPIYNNHYVQ